MTNIIMRLPAGVAATGLCRAEQYKLQGRGEFPTPVKLTAKAVGWRSQDVTAWIDSRPLAVAN